MKESERYGYEAVQLQVKTTLARYCNAVTTYGAAAEYEIDALRRFIDSENEVAVEHLVEETHRTLIAQAVTRRLIK